MALVKTMDIYLRELLTSRSNSFKYHTRNDHRHILGRQSYNSASKGYTAANDEKALSSKYI